MDPIKKKARPLALAALILKLIVMFLEYLDQD